MRKLFVVLAALSVGVHAAYAQGTGTVIVTVHGKNGPVAQADVTAGGVTRKTGADGTVSIALPPGRVDVVVTHEDFDPGAAQLEVRAGMESAHRSSTKCMPCFMRTRT